MFFVSVTNFDSIKKHQRTLRPEPGQTWIKTYPDGTTQRRWVRSVNAWVMAEGDAVDWEVQFSGDECAEGWYKFSLSTEWQRWSCEAELQPG